MMVGFDKPQDPVMCPYHPRCYLAIKPKGDRNCESRMRMNDEELAQDIAGLKVITGMADRLAKETFGERKKRRL